MIQACAMPGSGRSLRLIPSPSLTPAQAQAVVGSPFAVVVAPVEIWRGSARLGGGRWAGRRASCRLGRVGATAKESDLARPGEGAFFAPSLLEPSLSLFFFPPPSFRLFPLRISSFLLAFVGGSRFIGWRFFLFHLPFSLPLPQPLALFVFLSSSIPLSRRSGIRCFLPPPSLFRARRRDGLLGRRREAMPEEHAAERSWADGSFCRVARPLSASSFFSRRAHAFSLTLPVSGLFVRPSFVISSFAALGQDWHWPEWVARSVLCRLSFELGDAQRFGALPFHLYLVSPAARPSRGFKLRRTGRRRRLGWGWGGDSVEWNGWRNAPGRGPRRFARDALAAKSARRPILSSGFF